MKKIFCPLFLFCFSSLLSQNKIEINLQEFYCYYDSLLDFNPKQAFRSLEENENFTLSNSDNVYYKFIKLKSFYYDGDIDSLNYYFNQPEFNVNAFSQKERYLFFYLKSKLFDINGNKDSVIYYLLNANKYVSKKRKDIFDLSYSLASWYLNQGDINLYKKYFNNCLNNSNSPFNHMALKFLQTKNIIIQNKLDSALHNLLQLKKKCEKFKITESNLYINVLESIGCIYLELRIFDDAKDFFNQSLLISKRTGNKLKEQSSLMNLGFLYLNLNRLEEAKKKFNYLLMISSDNKHLSSTIYYNLSELALIQNNKTLASNYVDKCLFIDSINNNIYMLSSSLFLQGKVYLVSKAFNKSIVCFNKSIELSIKTNNQKLLARNYFYISKAYEEIENYKLAYNYYLKYKDLNDEIGGFLLAQKVEDIKIKYKVKELKTSNVELKEIIKKNKVVIWILVSSILVFLFFAYTYYKDFRKKINRYKYEINFLKQQNDKDGIELVKETGLLKSNLVDNLALYESQKHLVKSLNKNKNWAEFMMGFNAIHGDFLDAIKNKHQKVSLKDIRLISLIKLNLLDKEISTILGIEYDSMRKAKSRLKRKLKLNQNQSVENYINQFN